MESKLPAADGSIRTSTDGWNMWLWCFSTFVDLGVTDAFFRSQKRFGYFSEVGQSRAGIDPPCRRAISFMVGSICCSGALRAITSLLVSLYVCLHGETWLPSFTLKAC